ncbi:uncharacterized protein BDW47DRAFT_108900 [Aspergillus candidus]|uniref:Uncharacterized protein n=1 Tax=Aspergillus candidus TaxID=41067 RepID=A0A2I2F6X0_ASPCN|nr:hypothetical protein BDW47DRAFT_108900 [Aspergillus candidus]PLB36374.1 hypothetical protein BDW47DRAFT_108900 [Aspergillus candidus]
MTRSFFSLFYFITCSCRPLSHIPFLLFDLILSLSSSVPPIPLPRHHPKVQPKSSYFPRLGNPQSKCVRLDPTLLHTKTSTL